MCWEAYQKNETQDLQRTQDPGPYGNQDPMRIQGPMKTQDPMRTHGTMRSQDPKRTQDHRRTQDPRRTQNSIRTKTPWGPRTLRRLRALWVTRILWGPMALGGLIILWWPMKDPKTYKLAKVFWFPHHVFKIWWNLQLKTQRIAVNTYYFSSCKSRCYNFYMQLTDK